MNTAPSKSETGSRPATAKSRASSKAKKGSQKRLRSATRDAHKLNFLLKEEHFNVPSPFFTYLEVEKKYTERVIRVRTDLMQKTFILKKAFGVSEHLEQLKRWIDLTPSE